MFTDFLTECRAHKLLVNNSQPDVVGVAAKLQPLLKREAVRPVAVAAAA